VITHYVPLHSSKAGKKYGRASGDMNVTNDISQRLIRLPLFYGMQEQEVDRVTQAIKEFFS
jgi:dTDP-4-amino-4,6-dideoxygalactose transaminase